MPWKKDLHSCGQERSIKKDNLAFTYVKHLDIFIIVIVLICGLDGEFIDIQYIKIKLNNLVNKNSDSLGLMTWTKFYV